MNDKKTFFKIYDTEVKNLCKLSLSEMKIFLQLCLRMKYESGEVILTPSFREMMSQFLGVKKKTLYNIISSLIRKKILIKSDGLYYINNIVSKRG